MESYEADALNKDQTIDGCQYIEIKKAKVKTEKTWAKMNAEERAEYKAKQTE